MGSGGGGGAESGGSPGGGPESGGAAACMIFWRTSLIFSCRQTLVGKMSAKRAWKAAVAWAGGGR